MSLKFIGEFDNSLVPTIEEFDKRYTETFLLVETDNMCDIFFYKGSYTADDGKTICRFYNDAWGEIKLKPTTECKIKAVWPRVGMFNYKGKAIHVSKLPVRKNYRSANRYNTHFQFPQKSVFTNGGMPIDFDILRHALEERGVVKVIDALKMLEEENNISIALDNYFSLSIGDSLDSHILWHLSTPVGTFEHGKFVVDPHWRQEVVDMLKYTDQNYGVM